MAYEIKVPPLGESIVEATVARWLKQSGEAVAAGEPVVELETDKVNLEVAADKGGVLESISKNAGDTVAIGDLLGTIGDVAAVSAPVAAPATQPAPVIAEVSSPNGSTDIFATPTAQKVAAEHGVDPRQVAGSGPGGRVTKEDVLKFVGDKAQPVAAAVAAPAAKAWDSLLPSRWVAITPASSVGRRLLDHDGGDGSSV
ncbi:hypothetical protein HC891_14305 [Candidatus Gracilibacteria bacterium]|nr:hypothetical protein [Candidatus Gracilibacteria bacterium]